jgi:hypothetical protein
MSATLSALSDAPKVDLIQFVKGPVISTSDPFLGGTTKRLVILTDFFGI